MTTSNGTNGNDSIVGGNQADRLNGSNGNDTLRGSGSNDVLDGGNGNDLLAGDDGNDTLSGSAGNDTLLGGNGNDSVDGGSGNDSIHGDAGNDRIDGGSGDDLVLGDAGNDTVEGGSGNDTLDGGSGSDRLDAESGDDTAIYVMSDNIGACDFYDGGSGTDTLLLVLTQAQFSSASVQADLRAFARFLTSHCGDGTFQFNAFNLTVTDFEKLQVQISGGNASIKQFVNGDLEYDVVYPAFFSPNFQFNVKTTAHSSTSFTLQNQTNTNLTIVITGTGLAYANGAEGAYSPSAGVIQTITIKDGNTVLATITGLSENAPALLAAISHIPANDADFRAIMSAYHFSYDSTAVAGGYVGAGLFDNSDTFVGGAGDDAFRGYGGSDTYIGGSGDNAVDYGDEHGGHGVVVNFVTGTGTDTYGNAEYYTGMTKVWGSKYDDRMTGDDGNNLFEGREGNDTIDGGGNGDDIFYRSEQYYGATHGINANLDTGLVIDGFGDTDHVTNIESIDASDFNDTLVGNGADNDFTGYAGTDYFDGRDGHDGIHFRDESGSQGVLINLATGTGHDTYGNAETYLNLENVDGSQNNDTITGNGADNDFNGNGGADTYDGGDGSDSINYQDEQGSLGILVNLATGTGTDTWGNAETYVSIERVHASKNDDLLIGSDRDELFEGRRGDDTIDGAGGNDDIYYRSEAQQGGNHGINANLSTGIVIDGFGDTDHVSNIESIDATDFNDTLVGTAGDNWFNGYAGADSYDGGDGNDGVGFDQENGSQGVLINLATGTGHDTYGNAETYTSIENVTGSDNNDTITGNGANNYFEGRGGADKFDGSAGNDSISFRHENGSQGVLINLASGTGHDTYGNAETYLNLEGVDGSQNNDTIVGNAADNDFNGNAGTDTYDGGAGSDAVNYDQEFGGHGVVVNLATGQGTDTFGNHETLVSIERLHGSSYDDNFVGSGADELFEGRDGNDTIDGGGGNGDRIWYMSEANLGGHFGINANLATGIVIDGFGDTDHVSNIENITGTDQADVLIGNAAGNAFEGMGGADTYDGGSGGDDAVDFTHETGGIGIVVNLATNTGTDSYGNVETYLGGIDKIWGSQFNDLMTGNALSNLFEGHGGNDTMDGGAGFDTVWYLSEVHEGTTSGVAVNLATGTATDSHGNTDTLISIEAAVGTDFVDTLTGSTSDNQLTGFGGNDTISGGAGFDSIEGGAGADRLTGGADADNFNYSATNEGGDTITDFLSGTDHIGVVASAFGGGLVSGNPLSASYLAVSASGAATASGHGQFLFNTTSHVLSWDADGTGSGAAVGLATLTGVSSLTTGDFIII